MRSWGEGETPYDCRRDAGATFQPLAAATTFSAASFIVSATMKFRPESLQDLPARFHVRSFQAQHDRQLDMRLVRRFDHAGRQRIHAQDAAKNIDQHRFHVLVAQQDFKRVRDLFGIRAAAHIQEVRRHAAGVLDDVHGRHRQAGAIHHAADVAVELDVVQVVFRRLDFERIFFRDVAQFAQVGMAEQGVVVEVHLGIEREQATIGCRDERIDLDQRGVRGFENALYRLVRNCTAWIDVRRLESQLKRNLARLERLPGPCPDRCIP